MSRSETTDSTDPLRRIEELLADEALSNLDPSESAELRAANQKINPFHDVVSALTPAIAKPMAMPADLAARIERSAKQHIRVPIQAVVNAAPARQSMRIGHWAGWLVAAAACAALAVNTFWRTPEPVNPIVASGELTPAEARKQLLTDSNIVKLDFAGVVDKGAGGDVVWSDADQEGYMRLTNLPVNDPNAWQYQLWIFDANGNPAHPVDGGVFDVTSTGEVIVKIDPKIKVGKATMFAVTREKPGGTVVSDRAHIAVLAKPA